MEVIGNMTPKTEDAVVEMIRSRGEFGRGKYKTSMDRKDLTMSEWIIHYQEEMADGLQYAERMKGGAELLERARGMIASFSSDRENSWAEDWISDYEELFGGDS